MTIKGIHISASMTGKPDTGVLHKAKEAARVVRKLKLNAEKKRNEQVTAILHALDKVAKDELKVVFPDAALAPDETEIKVEFKE
jgi:hypothetical protein